MESSIRYITHNVVDNLHLQGYVYYLFMYARYNFDLDLSKDLKCTSHKEKMST